jgi:hypothetical protein
MKPIPKKGPMNEANTYHPFTIVPALRYWKKAYKTS